jgi:hypothetical protein
MSPVRVPDYIYAYGATRDVPPKVEDLEIYLRRRDAEARYEQVAFGSVWRLYLRAPHQAPVLLRGVPITADQERELQALGESPVMPLQTDCLAPNGEADPGVQHVWPAELEPDSECAVCGLAYAQWSAAATATSGP